MNVIVCIKEVLDTALSLDFGLSNRVVFREGQPLRLNPNDAEALAMSLGLKTPDEEEPVNITVISIGTDRVESYLRQGLALGAARAVRIWDEGFEALSSWQKARLLTAAVSFLGADLVFTGAESMDTGNGQVGPLMAAWLDFPCVGSVVGLELDEERKNLKLTRDIGRGERELVQCPLPTVITVKGEGRLPCASLDRVVESKYEEVTLLSLADLGITPAGLKNDPTRVTGISRPRPRPRKVPPLDSSLPAFYRILQLLEGGISKRQGKMLEGSSEELAERIFELLLAEGVLQPAADKGVTGK